MSFRPITKDEALAIHSAVVAKFGGIDGVRDEGFWSPRSRNVVGASAFRRGLLRLLLNLGDT